MSRVLHLVRQTKPSSTAPPPQTKKADTVLCIDPGLQGTGWAIVSRRRQELLPLACGVLHTSSKDRKLGWEKRAVVLAWELRNKVDQYNVQNVVCEFTEYHAGASKVMAWKTGDLQRLTFFVGVIYTLLLGAGIETVVVRTSHWKGQMNKQVVELRVRKHYGKRVMRELRPHTHAWDAMGMSLWYYGRL